MVQYKDQKEIGDHIVEDQRNIPVQWMLWLRQTRRDPPSIEELRLDAERIEATRHNARVLALRDAQAKEKALLERQAEHDEALQYLEQSQSRTASITSSETLADAIGLEAGNTSASAQANSSTRRPAARVPTSVVTDAEADATREDRVTSEGNVLRQNSGEAGGTISFTRQERRPDNDVWAASRARIRAQESQEGDSDTQHAAAQQSSSPDYSRIVAEKQERRQARNQEEASANAELERARKIMRTKSVLSDFDVEIDDGRQGATIQPRERR